VYPKAKWDMAMGMCRDMGGELATLETKDKVAFMIGYMHLNYAAHSKCKYKKGIGGSPICFSLTSTVILTGP